MSYYSFANHAGKYEREEMLEYLIEKMSGTGMLGAMKAKIFIANMEKYSLEEIERRMSDKFDSLKPESPIISPILSRTSRVKSPAKTVKLKSSKK